MALLRKAQAPSKRLLKKTGPPPLLPPKRLMTTLPKFKEADVPTWRNSEDAALVHHSKTPDHPHYVKVDTAMCPDATYFAVNRSIRNPFALVTVMDDGLCVAWSSCGTCHRQFKMCSCKRGIAAPRSVEYIYDKTRATLAKEEWNYVHPNYRGSFRIKIEEARQRAWEKRNAVSTARAVIRKPEAKERPSEPRKTRSGKPLLRKAARSVERPPEPPKRQRKAATVLEGAVTSTKVDSKVIDRAASKDADDITKRLLGGSTKPLLRKRKEGK
jgi:hypothetical protein